jgi:hypothetical protein
VLQKDYSIWEAKLFFLPTDEKREELTSLGPTEIVVLSSWAFYSRKSGDFLSHPCYIKLPG